MLTKNKIKNEKKITSSNKVKKNKVRMKKQKEKKSVTQISKSTYHRKQKQKEVKIHPIIYASFLGAVLFATNTLLHFYV